MYNHLIKIGGSAISSASDFKNLCKVISNYRSGKTIIIISAFGKTTRNLLKAAETAYSGNETAAIKIIDEIFDFHYSLSNKTLNLNEYKEKLLRMIKGIILTKELTPKLTDKILSAGENLALATIKSNFDADDFVFLESSNFIITDSNFGKANPIIQKSSELTISTLNQANGRTIITQGYIAKDINGCPTTMGFESSNLTATLIADFADLKELTIFSNVDGIRNIDPKIYPTTDLVKNLNYSDALSLADYGLKLLYSPMIELSANNSIKIVYRNLISKNDDFTIISENKSDFDFIILHSELQKNIGKDDNTKPILRITDHHQSVVFTDIADHPVVESGQTDIYSQYIIFYKNPSLLNKLFNRISKLDNILIDNYIPNAIRLIIKTDTNKFVLEDILNLFDEKL